MSTVQIQNDDTSWLIHVAVSITFSSSINAVIDCRLTTLGFACFPLRDHGPAYRLWFVNDKRLPLSMFVLSIISSEEYMNPSLWNSFDNTYRNVKDILSTGDNVRLFSQPGSVCLRAVTKRMVLIWKHVVLRLYFSDSNYLSVFVQDPLQ